MNKEQFMEVCYSFLAPRIVRSLADQAESKGYFDEADAEEQVEEAAEISFTEEQELTPVEKKKAAYIQACSLADELYNTLNELRHQSDTRRTMLREDYLLIDSIVRVRKLTFERNADLQGEA